MNLEPGMKVTWIAKLTHGDLWTMKGVIVRLTPKFAVVREVIPSRERKEWDAIGDEIRVARERVQPVERFVRS